MNEIKKGLSVLKNTGETAYNFRFIIAEKT